MAKMLQIEPTPNPLAYKIRLDQKVTDGGSRHYAKKEEAYDNPLAQKFFDIHGVESVFFMEDFITVAKTSGGIWDFIFFKTNEILMEVREIRPIVTGEAGSKAKAVNGEFWGEFEKLTSEERLTRINEVLDEKIRPGLARDGGGLTILGLEGNTLRVRYQGACGSCPSSTAQTLNYISTLLQERVSPDLSVMPV